MRSAACTKCSAPSRTIATAYGSITAGSAFALVTGIAGLPRSGRGTGTLIEPFGPVVYVPVTVVAVPMNASLAWSYWPNEYVTPVALTLARAYATRASVPSVLFRALIHVV